MPTTPDVGARGAGVDLKGREVYPSECRKGKQMIKSLDTLRREEIAHLRQLRAAVIKTRDRATAQAGRLRAAIGTTGARPTAGGKPPTDKALERFAKEDEANARSPTECS